MAIAGSPFPRPIRPSSGVWTRPALDLRPYAGQDVQIAFHFKSAASVPQGYGWEIDDVMVESNLPDWDPITGPEQFDNGLGESSSIMAFGRPPASSLARA